MRWIFSVVATFLFVLSVNAQDANSDEIIEYDTIGNWIIRVDTTLSFRCFAFATYGGDNTFLRFGANSGGEDFYFTVGDTRWRSIEEGTSYPIEIELDDYGPWNADAIGVDFNGINALWVSSVDQQFLMELAKAEGLAVRYNDSDILNLNLMGSAKALSRLADCERDVDSVLSETGLDPFAGGNKAQSDPFAVGGRND